jgi:predicted permease
MAGNRGTYRRYALVFAELALTVLLVISAGLFARTFLKAWQENPGFDPSHLTIASASMQDARYSKTADGARLFRETVERIEHIPGVESAAVALSSPFTRPLNDWVPEVNGKAADAITDLNYGTPHLFDTLRTRLLRGRTFTERDNAASPRVAVVNEAFVKRYLKNLADPIGATFKTEDQRWTIIGVVSSVEEENGMSGTAPVGYLPEAYVPVQQFPDGLFEGANRWFSPVWIVRTRASDAELESRIRRAIASVDPMLPLASFKKIDLLHEDELARERYRAIVLSSLATLALVLAALGVYGLTAQSVAQRTREMGIRMALGATTQKVIGHSAAPAIGIASAAIATGVAAALYVTRLMKDLIWNIEPTDLTTYAAVIIVLLAVTALAAIVPAMKLVRLDPAQVLHEE